MTMEGQAVTMEQLKTKLTNVSETIPNQPIAIRVEGNALSNDTQRIVALCHELKLKAHIVTKPTCSAARNHHAVRHRAGQSARAGPAHAPVDATFLRRRGAGHAG